MSDYRFRQFRTNAWFCVQTRIIVGVEQTAKDQWRAFITTIESDANNFCCSDVFGSKEDALKHANFLMAGNREDWPSMMESK